MASQVNPPDLEVWSAACDGQLSAEQWNALLAAAPARSDAFAQGRAVWAAHHAVRDALTTQDAPALSETYHARMWAALERESNLGGLVDGPSAVTPVKSAVAWWQRWRAAPAVAGAAFAGVAAVGFVGFSVMSVVGPGGSGVQVAQGGSAVPTAAKPAPVLALADVPTSASTSVPLSAPATLLSTPTLSVTPSAASADAVNIPIPVEYLLAHRQLSAGLGSAGAAQGAGVGYMRAAYGSR